MPASASVVLYDARGGPLVVDGGEPETRADRWENYQTGIGTPGDKTTAGRFMPVWRLFDQELTNLFNGSALAAKIVEKRPKEMFRCGFDLEADGLEASDVEDLRDHATEVLRLETQMQETAIWGRLYGGSLLLLGADDGGQPWEPLDETRIRTFGYVNQVDRRYAYPQTYYTDPLSPKCGQPETYLVSNSAIGLRSGQLVARKSASEILKAGWSTQVVHETRALRFDGNLADAQTRQQLIGWSWPLLQRIYDTMRAFEHAFDSAGYLLSDASQAVFKLQGLLSAISAGRRQEVAARVRLIEETRSVARAVLLDAGANETFERTPTQFAGVSDVLDRWMLRFAADADMPATELFGRAPAGLNATGDSDTRKWYDTIASEQTTDLAPRLKRIFRLMCLSDDSPVGKRDVKFKVVFKPLWSPTDAEMATTNLAVAQRDVAYIGEGVVSPEEVALDRADLYPSMVVEAREKAIKGAQSFDPHENDPEPEPPPVVPGAPGASPPAPVAGKGAVKAAPPKNPKLDAGHKVQALVFTKGHFTKEEARAYCAANGHGCASVRETAKTYRVRQAAPDAFREASFKTLELAPGVRAIVGRTRSGRTAAAPRKDDAPDDEPRDTQGQWTAEGGGGDVSKMQLLGEGANRKVYAHGEAHVIKVAKNTNAKKENKAEVEASGKNELLATVSDHAHDHSWVKQERLTPASDGELAKAAGISAADAKKTYTVMIKGPPGWPDQAVSGKSWLFAAVHSATGMGGDRPKSAGAFIAKLQRLKSDVPKLDLRDLAYANQWGLSKSGAPKIADYGFTS